MGPQLRRLFTLRNWMDWLPDAGRTKNMFGAAAILICASAAIFRFDSRFVFMVASFTGTVLLLVDFVICISIRAGSFDSVRNSTGAYQ